MEMRPPAPEDQPVPQEPAPENEGPVVRVRQPSTGTEWRVSSGLVTLKIIGAVAFGLIPTAFGLNPASRWFGWVVTLGLAVYALRDLLAPVRLAADPDGVTVVSGFAGHRRLGWDEIERVRIDHTRRAEFLEIDAGESLYLFSRYDLGTSPTEALPALNRLRPRTD
jgi:hypothetical protein